MFLDPRRKMKLENHLLTKTIEEGSFQANTKRVNSRASELSVYIPGNSHGSSSATALTGSPLQSVPSHRAPYLIHASHCTESRVPLLPYICRSLFLSIHLHFPPLSSFWLFLQIPYIPNTFIEWPFNLLSRAIRTKIHLTFESPLPCCCFNRWLFSF